MRVSTNLPILIIDRRPDGGQSISSHKTRLQLVKDVMSDGRLDEAAWGSDRHIAAVEEIERYAMELRHELVNAKLSEEPPPETAQLCSICKEPVPYCDCTVGASIP